jgi:hypothetical protein
MPVVERSAFPTPTSSRSVSSVVLRADTSASAVPGTSSNALSVIHRTASSGSERISREVRTKRKVDDYVFTGREGATSKGREPVDCVLGRARNKQARV